MKQLSIFHDLPCWGHLQINQLLDPMHIFKNVGVALGAHLVGDRDLLGACEDLSVVDKMHLQVGPRGRVVLKAPWIFSKCEEEIMKSDIASFHTPMGHMHCLREAFTKDNKLSGLKAHDWHKMLQV